tara:strand:- start:8520 stop:9593 length:1074 start_codon:yes stop_codon:yes gene_type:complete
MSLNPNAKPFLSGGLGLDHTSDGADAPLGVFVPEVWGASIKDYMEKNLVFGSLANDLSAMVAGGGDVIHLPKHSEIVAEDLYGSTEASSLNASGGISFTDMANGGMETEHQLIVNQSSYSAVAISDIAQAQASYDVMNIYTEKLGYALAKKIDFYLAQKLYQAVTFNDPLNTDADGVSTNAVDFTTGGTYNITASGLANLVQAIYEADANISDFSLVLTPATYASLYTLAEFQKYEGTGVAGDSNLLINGFAGKLVGMDVIISNNFVHAVDSGSYTQTASPKFNKVNGNTSDADELAGYAIHKDALHIAYASGMKARVQSDYNLESLSTRFVADSVYGCLVTSNTGTNKKLFALTDA